MDKHAQEAWSNMRSHIFNTSIFQVIWSEIGSLQFNQEETDNRIVIYIEYVADQGFKSSVVQTLSLLGSYVPI